MTGREAGPVGPAGFDRVRLRVGTLTRSQLVVRLRVGGVLLNRHAHTLLEDAVFDAGSEQTFLIAERSVEDLGLTVGAVLSRILAAGQQQGLGLCPAVTGPYLRLARPDQASAPDSVMRSGRAPTGSVTVASAPLREDDSYPKGFYLRTVDGQPWLRGYRCDDRHVWSPGDRFAFRLPPT